MLRAEGDKIRVTASTQVLWSREREEEWNCVTALELEDRTDTKPNQPLVYLVRRDGESLWELGKAYRASPEVIQALNGEDAKLLLIPVEG